MVIEKPAGGWIRADTSIAALLCLACGIADAIGYLYASVFAANMTGNTVLAGISLAKRDHVGALAAASTFVTFFVGAMAGRRLLRRARSPWLPLLAEALVLTAAAVIDPERALAVTLVAFAMGMQATAITSFRGRAVSTVVVTSTLARLAEAASDAIARDRSMAEPNGDGGAMLLAMTWISYACGATLAVFFASLVEKPLLVSATIVLVVSWATRKQTLPPLPAG
jgi:uncharacterized membrane protein YoaK (UPF0700 family)